MTLDSIVKTMGYQPGSIKSENRNAKLDVPQSFYFINAKQSQYILEYLWQNLRDASVLRGKFYMELIRSKKKQEEYPVETVSDNNENSSAV